MAPSDTAKAKWQILEQVTCLTFCPVEALRRIVGPEYDRAEAELIEAGRVWRQVFLHEGLAVLRDGSEPPAPGVDSDARLTWTAPESSKALETREKRNQRPVFPNRTPKSKKAGGNRPLCGDFQERKVKP